MSAPVLPAGRPKEIASFQAHPYDAQALAFSPDDKTLASGGREGKVKLWDAISGKKLLDISAHHDDGRRGLRAWVKSVAFSPDGKLLASCGDDRTIKLWDVATGENTACIDANVPPPLLFSPNGKTLVAGYELFDLETRKARKIVEKPGMWPAVAFDPKGNLRVGMSFMYPNPPSFIVWDVESGKEILTYKGDRKVVQFEAFSPDGKMAVSTEGDYRAGGQWSIRLWNVTTGKNLATFNQPEIPCTATFSPDGKVLAVIYRPSGTRTEPSPIRLLEMPSGKVLATLKGHRRFTGCMVFSPNGRLLASGGGDGVIKIWSLPKRYKAE
ncbi:MAG TPA: WD40 repeat domain-containing protein [Gemmataceae bacterium]